MNDFTLCVCAYTCLQLIVLTGCGNHSDADKAVNDAVVAVRCDNIVSNGWLLYRVKEIWKDESEGRFVFKANDVINQNYLLSEQENVGQESLLLHDGRGKIIERFPDVMFIHNGRLPALGGILASELKEKFMREKKDDKRKSQ